MPFVSFGCELYKYQDSQKVNFVIVENIRNHNEWDTVKGFLIGLLKIIFLLALIPFLLVLLLFGLFKRNDSSQTVIDWIEFYRDENLKLERLFIDENEIPDNLDYPEEPNDIYLFQIKSSPEIHGLQNMFFDFQFVKTDRGIFLLSFNEMGEGMSLWYIDSKNLYLEKINDLKSSWWNLKEKDGKIALTTRLDRKDINIEIEENGL